MRQIAYKRRRQTTGIVIHDSHTTPEGHGPTWYAQAVRGGWDLGLLSCGYHFVVERDGRVIEARPADTVGSHTPGFNLEWIGACLVGGREEDRPCEAADNFTEPQRSALRGLIWDLLDRYGKDLQIRGHSELQRYRNKSLPPCPALNMDRLRESLSQRTAT